MKKINETAIREEEFAVADIDQHEARLRHIHCVSVPNACIACCEETGQVAIGDDEPHALHKMRALLERSQPSTTTKLLRQHAEALRDEL
jgi:hypothetical protein